MFRNVKFIAIGLEVQWEVLHIKQIHFKSNRKEMFSYSDYIGKKTNKQNNTVL